LEEEIFVNSCLRVHRSIRKTRIVAVIRLADHIFVTRRKFARARFAGSECVKYELLLLLLLELK